MITQERDDLKRQYDGWRKKRCVALVNWCQLILIHKIQSIVSMYDVFVSSYLCFTDWHTRLDEFMAGFNVISLKLKEMYQVCELDICCIRLCTIGSLYLILLNITAVSFL